MTILLDKRNQTAYFACHEPASRPETRPNPDHVGRGFLHAIYHARLRRISQYGLQADDRGRAGLRGIPQPYGSRTEDNQSAMRRNLELLLREKANRPRNAGRQIYSRRW